MEFTKTLEEYAQATTNNNYVLVYKHSTQCPISAAAKKEVDAFLKEHDVPYVAIRVIEERSLSNEVATQTGVTHQSPQVIILQENTPVYNTSHRDITKEHLNEAWNSAKKS